VYFVFVYKNRTMKLVEMVVRREGRGVNEGGNEWRGESN
jgi:hypothetical protein